MFRCVGRSSFGAQTHKDPCTPPSYHERSAAAPLYFRIAFLPKKHNTTLLRLRCSRKPEKVLEILNAAEIRRQAFANLSLSGEYPWAATLHPCIAIKLICADVFLWLARVNWTILAQEATQRLNHQIQSGFRTLDLWRLQPYRMISNRHHGNFMETLRQSHEFPPFLMGVIFKSFDLQWCPVSLNTDNCPYLLRRCCIVLQKLLLIAHVVLPLDWLELPLASVSCVLRMLRRLFCSRWEGAWERGQGVLSFERPRPLLLPSSNSARPLWLWVSPMSLSLNWFLTALINDKSAEQPAQDNNEQKMICHQFS